MVSKGARRRLKDKRKQLDADIQNFFSKQQSASSVLGQSRNDELFLFDKTGNAISVETKTTDLPRGHPIVRKLTKPKSKGIVKKTKPKTKAARSSLKAEKFFDIWAEEAMDETKSKHSASLSATANRIRFLGKGLRPSLPALAIDRAGCSFNPDPVQHQDALKRKERYEHMRVKKESKVPDIDAYAQETMVDELQQFKFDKKEESSEEEEEETVLHRPKFVERKTKAQRNKEARHKLHLKGIEERKRIKKLNGEINNAKQINRQITKEIEEQHLRGLERKAMKMNIESRGLRRLGRKVLYNAPFAVLSSEEAQSSTLRTLHASNDMALNRYISLQKRGLVDVGRYRGRKNKTRYKYTHPGAAQRRLEEAKEEIPALQKRVQELHHQLQEIKLAETENATY